MTGYAEKYVKASSARLEEWLGFMFERSTKRNGRTRQEHLSRVNEARRETSKQRVEADYAEHPDASIQCVAKELGLNWRTVRRYAPRE